MEADRTNDGGVPAGFGRRVIAKIIDELVLSPTAIGGAYMGYVSCPLQPDIMLISPDECALLGALKVYLPASALYNTVLHGLQGQTIGKRVMGLTVIGSAEGAIGISEGFTRWLGSLVSTGLLGYGYLRALWDPQRRTLHDIWAGTKVVKVSSEPFGGSLPQGRRLGRH